MNTGGGKLGRLALAVAALVAVPFEAAAAGGAPGAPVVHTPEAGGTFGAQSEQVFAVAAVDPDGDQYRAVFSVTDTTTGAVVTFGSPQVRSGAIAQARPPVPLTSGRYTWTASAVDVRGNAGPSSAPRGLSVTRFPVVDHPSGDCAAGSPTPVDGVLGGVYVRSRYVVPPGAGEAWLCVRTDGFGGKLVLRTPAGSILPEPQQDGDVAACSAPGNALPGPHPLAADGTGNSLDVHQGPAGISVCVQAGTAAFRVLLPTSALVGGAAVAFVDDGPGWRRPPLATNTAQFSGRCSQPGAITAVNAAVYTGHVWLQALPGEGTLAVCARVTAGSQSRGAMLVLDSGGVRLGDDTSRCDNTLVAHDDSPLTISADQAPPRLPTAVCAMAAGVGTASFSVTGRELLAFRADP